MIQAALGAIGNLSRIQVVVWVSNGNSRRGKGVGRLSGLSQWPAKVCWCVWSVNSAVDRRTACYLGIGSLGSCYLPNPVADISIKKGFKLLQCQVESNTLPYTVLLIVYHTNFLILNSLSIHDKFWNCHCFNFMNMLIKNTSNTSK